MIDKMIIAGMLRQIGFNVMAHDAERDGENLGAYLKVIIYRAVRDGNKTVLDKLTELRCL